MLLDVESDMYTEFRFRFFLLMVRKAWDYEKSVPAAPTTWGILHLVVSLNVAIALPVRLEVLGIKCFDRR